MPEIKFSVGPAKAVWFLPHPTGACGTQINRSPPHPSLAANTATAFRDGKLRIPVRQSGRRETAHP